MSDSPHEKRDPLHSPPDALDLPPTQPPSSGVPGASTLAEVPQRLGRYVIRRQLGKGGMGAVYLAHDTQMEREIALKVPNFRADENPAVLERFYREARTAGRLQHPNICPMYDVDQVEGIHYISMAYIEGLTLAQHVPGYLARPPQDAVALIRTLALAINEAHRHGIIHRDLKPQNVMVNLRGEPVVMDFGLAREIKSASSELSHPGMVLGTPDYMSPEQARGDLTAMGPGCDVYSLGVVLYQLLSGKVPFRGSTLEVIASHLHAEPPPLSALRQGLDPRLEVICRKAMAKEPSQRFLGMTEFAQALDEFLQGGGPLVATETTTETDPLAQIASDALHVLRTWGWREGSRKLQRTLTPEKTANEPERALLIRWLAGDASAHDEARATYAHLRPISALTGWAILGRAFLANFEQEFKQAEAILRQVEGDASDSILKASIAHQRGVCQYRLGRLSEALNLLHAALDSCGRDHAITGMVLDALGLVYLRKNNCHTAGELYRQAAESAERFSDEYALARSKEHLGLLQLGWGNLNAAEDNFQQALVHARKNGFDYGLAVLLDFLGEVAFRRGQREAEAGRKTAAKKCYKEAADLFEASARGYRALQHPDEGFAHKDRARLAIAQGDLALAEEQVRLAETCFQDSRFEMGLAHVRHVSGIVHRLRERPAESTHALNLALDYFDRTSDVYSGALTQLELARTLAASDEVQQLTTSAYVDALRRAEASRRDELVILIEDELKGIDEEAHWKHVFHRVRGRGATTRTGSLDAGENENATAIYLDLAGFSTFCQGLDSADVMRTLNQMMADLDGVLAQYKGFVTAYLGGGFMALVRGQGHAARAVQAALDMIDVVTAFNRPRVVLGLRQLPVRIGLASGNLFLGNIGTYSKMDFTAVGIPVNLASRLGRQAESNRACLSQSTYDLVRDRFRFPPDNPRIVELKGFGRCSVWDVLGGKKE